MFIVGVLDTTANFVNLYSQSLINSFFGVISPFFTVLPNILICRLMLNLRTFSSPEEMSRATQLSEGMQFSGLHFATNSFLGNIGAPLNGDAMEKDEADED
ncbi:hypothetical protein GYMLUDRAFT_243686 [Collybiopsis luxurians FD-317 M1]|uniref:Uncharacterized protein n=1 Tax=Collybiopsis luxurians FD-317 M1 TaxID=944289 RepID=A0A0D0CG23_9AGAR|nr:hypothetical protein GYMLUDRAFT_243686 [Collybiopsis luxurians FD-317 M1]